MRFNLSPWSRFPLVGTLLLLLASCNPPLDTAMQWRLNNESAFREYADKEDYTKSSIEGSTAYVYMKWLTHGDGKEYPIETSRIQCHYEMRLLVNDQLVDGNYSSERPTLFAINRGSGKQLVEGVRIGLQQMVVGDEAEIIIPWYLAYGEIRQEQIMPYSALKFKVRLEKIIPEEKL